MRVLSAFVALAALHSAARHCAPIVSCNDIGPNATECCVSAEHGAALCTHALDGGAVSQTPADDFALSLGECNAANALNGALSATPLSDKEYTLTNNGVHIEGHVDECALESKMTTEDCPNVTMCSGVTSADESDMDDAAVFTAENGPFQGHSSVRESDEADGNHDADAFFDIADEIEAKMYTSASGAQERMNLFPEGVPYERLAEENPVCVSAVPVHYYVHLVPNFARERFTGRVLVRIRIASDIPSFSGAPSATGTKPGNAPFCVAIPARLETLGITDARVGFAADALTRAAFAPAPARDAAIVKVAANALPSGGLRANAPLLVELSYSAPLHTTAQGGFFHAPRAGVAGGRLDALWARDVMPCWDDIRATFSLTIDVPAGMAAVGPTAVAQTQVLGGASGHPSCLSRMCCFKLAEQTEEADDPWTRASVPPVRIEFEATVLPIAPQQLGWLVYAAETFTETELWTLDGSSAGVRRIADPKSMMRVSIPTHPKGIFDQEPSPRALSVSDASGFTGAGNIVGTPYGACPAVVPRTEDSVSARSSSEDGSNTGAIAGMRERTLFRRKSAKHVFGRNATSSLNAAGKQPTRIVLLQPAAWALRDTRVFIAAVRATMERLIKTLGHSALPERIVIATFDGALAQTLTPGLVVLPPSAVYVQDASHGTLPARARRESVRIVAGALARQLLAVAAETADTTDGGRGHARWVVRAAERYVAFDAQVAVLGVQGKSGSAEDEVWADMAVDEVEPALLQDATPDAPALVHAEGADAMPVHRSRSAHGTSANATASVHRAPTEPVDEVLYDWPKPKDAETARGPAAVTHGLRERGLFGSESTIVARPESRPTQSAFAGGFTRSPHTLAAAFAGVAPAKGTAIFRMLEPLVEGGREGVIAAIRTCAAGATPIREAPSANAPGDRSIQYALTAECMASELQTRLAERFRASVRVAEILRAWSIQPGYPHVVLELGVEHVSSAPPSRSTGTRSTPGSNISRSTLSATPQSHRSPGIFARRESRGSDGAMLEAGPLSVVSAGDIEAEFTPSSAMRRIPRRKMRCEYLEGVVHPRKTMRLGSGSSRRMSDPFPRRLPHHRPRRLSDPFANRSSDARANQPSTAASIITKKENALSALLRPSVLASSAKKRLSESFMRIPETSDLPETRPVEGSDTEPTPNNFSGSALRKPLFKTLALRIDDVSQQPRGKELRRVVILRQTPFTASPLSQSASATATFGGLPQVSLWPIVITLDVVTDTETITHTVVMRAAEARLTIPPDTQAVHIRRGFFRTETPASLISALMPHGDALPEDSVQYDDFARNSPLSNTEAVGEAADRLAPMTAPKAAHVPPSERVRIVSDAFALAMTDHIALKTALHDMLVDTGLVAAETHHAVWRQVSVDVGRALAALADMPVAVQESANAHVLRLTQAFLSRRTFYCSPMEHEAGLASERSSVPWEVQALNPMGAQKPYSYSDSVVRTFADSVTLAPRTSLRLERDNNLTHWPDSPSSSPAIEMPGLLHATESASITSKDQTGNALDESEHDCLHMAMGVVIDLAAKHGSDNVVSEAQRLMEGYAGAMNKSVRAQRDTLRRNAQVLESPMLRNAEVRAAVFRINTALGSRQAFRFLHTYYDTLLPGYERGVVAAAMSATPHSDLSAQLAKTLEINDYPISLVTLLRTLASSITADMLWTLFKKNWRPILCFVLSVSAQMFPGAGVVLPILMRIVSLVPFQKISAFIRERSEPLLARLFGIARREVDLRAAHEKYGGLSAMHW